MCNTLELDFEFIDAINGNELPNDRIMEINSFKWIQSKYKRQLSPSEIGCSLSHLKIYERLRNSDEWFIVLEDDVFIDERLAELARCKFDSMDTSSLYLLGGQDGLDSFKRVIFSRYGLISLRSNITFKRTLYSERYLYRTCCYLMHSTLASKILAFNVEKLLLADDWYNLSKYNVLNNIYYTNLVQHPCDLNNSIIEIERRNLTGCNKNILREFLKKIFFSFRELLRVF